MALLGNCQNWYKPTFMNLPRDGRVNGTSLPWDREVIRGNRPVLKGQWFNPPRESNEEKRNEDNTL